MNDCWYIWFKVFEGDKYVGGGVYHQAYKHKSSAVRRAKQMWSTDTYNPMTGTTIRREWIVSKTSPWNESQKTHYNPVAEAYEILYKVHNSPIFDSAEYAVAVEEAIGFLGEALA